MFEGFRSSAATNPVPIAEKKPNVVQYNNGPKEWSVKETEYPVKWADHSITYVVVTQDRLENNKRNFPVILPYVDRAVVIDGFSKDGTYEYLKSLGPKVQVFQNPWRDSFAAQYDQYLKQIKGGWVLLCDDDELPSEGLLKGLRELVEKSEVGSKFGVVEFRANDISYQVGKWNERVDNGPVDYYRQIFFKWFPDMRYDIDLHQALQGMRGPVARCQEHYYHIKSTRDEYRNACRNYWIAGCWPGGGRRDGVRTAEWHELKELAAKHHPEVKYFSDFNALMVSDTLHPDLVDFIRRHKDFKRGDPDDMYNELRAYYRYFFEILHPERPR